MNSRIEAVTPERIRRLFPEEGLFADKDWLLSPEAFALTSAEVDEFEKLGYRLHLFLRACNQLYALSAQGRREPWVAEYLDRGKPASLVEGARAKALRPQLPRVIRPDVILTGEGYSIAELDNVPGGIGLTGWLNRTYAELTPHEIVGGSEGMIDGFRSIFPQGDILVSEEASTYRPEMEWLAAQINAQSPGALEVQDAENYVPHGRAVYRFFELFDLPNLPAAGELLRLSAAGELEVTPPMKPQLEEKMWAALFWMRPLREFWRRELHERHWMALQHHFPVSWIVDPTPLPQHAVIPGLEIQNWEELAGFSQKERELILKISGFSERAWGSRGVVLAQDMPHADWKTALEEALGEFESHPRILQRFHKGRVVRHPYFDRDTGEVRVMQGRVRLCPYYFVVQGKTRLGGILATICPADKKLLHGMRDAILVPCRVAEPN